MSVRKITLVLQNEKEIDVPSSDICAIEIYDVKENYKLINIGNELMEVNEKLCHEFRLEFKYSDSLKFALDQDEIVQIVVESKRESLAYNIDFRTQQQVGHDGILWVSGWI